MDIIWITAIESIYLIYMFFFYKTNINFNYALFDTKLNSMGSFFIHDTNRTENKICLFGKFMAIIAIILAWVRVYYMNNNTINITIGFDISCVILAYLMNINALIYILPLIVSEIYIINNYSN